MLKFYYNPGSCSLASHAALIEAALDFEAEWIDLTRDVQFSEAFRSKNRWARIPALEAEGRILTENAAILTYIAGLVPEQELLPADGFERARAIEWLALLSSTVHIAFRPFFRPNRLASTEAGQADVREFGLQSLKAVLANLDEAFGQGPYILGERFNLCDLYLFVFVMWSRRPVLNADIGLLPTLDPFADRLARRPSVAMALQREGIALPDRMPQAD